jgi:metallo-beta-lactamase family protein
MLQGIGSEEHNKKKFEYDPASIDSLFATHAHIDHIGLIPKLVKEGFKGRIYSTPETRSIGELLLLDAAKINGEDAKLVHNALVLWETLDYHELKDLPAGRQASGFRAEFFDAGHVLGSAMVKVTGKGGKSMLFSGDIGNSPSLFLKDWEKVEGLDYLLMESVYGDRNHEEKVSREEKFGRVVKEAVERRGALLIPAFSLERTQVILYELNNLFENKKIPEVPVYLDSPLAIRITDIYEKVKGVDNFDFKELHNTAAIRDSREIAAVPGPKIIIAGSGMSTAGRILFHEENFLPDPNSTILLMGYQAPGTLGREIEEGVKKVVINNKQIPVRAKVETIHGFSAHADSDELVRFAEPSADTLKKVFVAMGEPKSSIFLAQRLRDELDLDAVVAEKGKTYELDL